MRLKAYLSYHESQIEWVSELPSEWYEQPFFAAVRERKAKNFGLKEENLLSLSYGQIIRKDISLNDGLLPESFETYQVVRPADIVFRFTDLQNDKRSLRSALVEERGIITSAYLSVTPVRHDARYFAYLMRSYDNQKVFYSMGGGLRQSLKFDDVKHLRIITPPDEEQKRIADYLDAQTAKIDLLIEKQRRLIETLAERRQAVINHAVTKGLDPNLPVKDSGVEWMGVIPAAWTLTRVRYVASILGGFAPEHALPDKHGKFPYFRVADLNGAGIDYSISSSTELINDKNLVAQVGTVLFPKRGGAIFTNKVTIMSVCGAFDTNLMGVVLNDDKVDPLFFAHWLKSRSLGELADTSTLPQINNKHIYPLRIGLPNLSEQRKVSKYIALQTARMDALSGKAREMIDVLKERRQALISAAVTGKIDVRGLR
ncbi:restriction endonuclease subunit S [Subtercola frigoramans]|uniref:Type I restriction enzyme S subunit n=1 Tax=Subtercola frigoramans TaxID=120298 RepID=A0ABS2L1S4_9MICO|nr:restriction endonuclease subunit S [Subtercola frigoramans]MBM7471029.1 type I restriction enzyme S subunit [Subtercola frigoramans]